MFRHHEQQRQAILDELLLGVLNFLQPGGGTKAPPRHYLAHEGDGPLFIQVGAVCIFFSLHTEVACASLVANAGQVSAHQGCDLGGMYHKSLYQDVIRK